MFSDMVSEWAVHQMVAWAMVLSGTVTLVSLLFVAAPYGRFSPDNKDAKADDAAGKAKAAAVTPVAPGSWGPLIPPRVAWIVMESPASLVSLALWVFAGDAQHCTSNPTNVVLLALFQLHYINRAFVYPFRTRGGNKMPFSIMAMAWIFCTFNGYLQGRYISYFARYSPDEWQSPRFLAGVAVFLLGWAINLHSDTILANLRKPGEAKTYKIPHGGAFNLVSAANYFGEILEWCGWALCCDSLAAVAFCYFTFCNLAPRGAASHKWYLAKFPNYPAHRKAVIPFVW